MPVKPVDTVPDWGSAGNYPASLYPVNLPWGDPNPVGGLPTPWSGQPRLNATAFTSFANNGFSPQVPTDASSMNEWDRRIGVYVNWVILGTSAADADAHIMETNGAGLSAALAYEATVGFQGAGGTPATLLNGAVVPDNKDILLGVNGVVSGGAGSECGPFSVVQGSTIDTGSTGILKVNNAQFYTDATPSTVGGNVQYDGHRLSLGRDGSAFPVYAPAVNYVDHVATVAALTDLTGLTVTLDIEPAREVLIELLVHQEVDTATEVPTLEIGAQNSGGADIVTRLKNGSADQARSALPATVLGGDRRPNSISIVWRPDDDIPVPANNTWTIRARHGVTGGATMDSTNCTIRVTYR